MEKHGRLGECIEELQQMLQTPIIPYAPPSPGDGFGPSKHTEPSEEHEEEGPGEEELSSDSPCSSPSPSHSDLEELLVKEYSHNDLPGLITRTSGKGEGGMWRVREGCGG